MKVAEKGVLESKHIHDYANMNTFAHTSLSKYINGEMGPQFSVMFEFMCVFFYLKTCTELKFTASLTAYLFILHLCIFNNVLVQQRKSPPKLIVKTTVVSEWFLTYCINIWQCVCVR
jgi:hypothetical protein